MHKSDGLIEGKAGDVGKEITLGPLPQQVCLLRWVYENSMGNRQRRRRYFAVPERAIARRDDLLADPAATQVSLHITNTTWKEAT